MTWLEAIRSARVSTAAGVIRLLWREMGIVKHGGLELRRGCCAGGCVLQRGAECCGVVGGAAISLSSRPPHPAAPRRTPPHPANTAPRAPGVE